MMFECNKCGGVFAKQRDLTAHGNRKRPCDVVNAHKCTHCPKTFTRIDNMTQHKKSCRAALAAECEYLRHRLAESQTPSAPQGPAVAIMGSNIVNTTVNNVVNHVNSVRLEISPWGSPLQLTDADIEAALATVPGIAGTPALPEVVAALMELVKRAHMPPAARNIHLNPKRTDQALALMPGGWAAMPLEEATAALFDGASASMAAARAPTMRQMMRTTLPVQYRAERAASVQLGMRPMGAHLLNVAPGGPGPLLLTGPAAAGPAAATGVTAAAQQPAETDHDSFDAVRACGLLKSHPAVAGVTAAWLARVTAAAGVSALGLARALRRASAAGLCSMAEWQGILRLQRDSAV